MKTFFLAETFPFDPTTLNDLNEYISNGGVIKQIVPASNGMIITAYNSDEMECMKCDGVECCIEDRIEGDFQQSVNSGAEQYFDELGCLRVEINSVGEQVVEPIRIIPPTENWDRKATNTLVEVPDVPVPDAPTDYLQELHPKNQTLLSLPISKEGKKVIQLEIDAEIPTRDLMVVFSPQTLEVLFNQAVTGETLNVTVHGPVYKNVVILD